MLEHSTFWRVCKRALDILLPLILLPLVLPLMAVVALVVRIGMGSPVLFKQVRPGLNEKPFAILKFRTMRDQLDSHGRPRPDGARLTALGKVLRKLSLDELPQVWNVLAGHMSLVGPRPLLMDYLPCYSERHRRRHTVRPGITGWAQVCGRNAIDWDLRLELDLWYLDHWNFWLDLRILVETVKCVLLSRGVSKHGRATMPQFMGIPGPSTIRRDEFQTEMVQSSSQESA
jgi:lipopolysaccharide/colanic/teichoic acid biosynthesis glycosyltransferase